VKGFEAGPDSFRVVVIALLQLAAAQVADAHLSGRLERQMVWRLADTP
jgi:hypothetical protein